MWAVHWAALRYQHTAAIRSALAARYPSAASANQRLAALRGVLKKAWRLGQLPIEDYQSAAACWLDCGARKLVWPIVVRDFQSEAGDHPPPQRPSSAVPATKAG